MDMMTQIQEYRSLGFEDAGLVNAHQQLDAVSQHLESMSAGADEGVDEPVYRSVGHELVVLQNVLD